jgi:organic radical activating enzyme
MIKIMEHFYSLQGEGSRMGIPSYFIRLGFCPFRCKFCDSKFALSSTKHILSLSTDNDFRKFYSDNMYNKAFQSVVITGGEPLYVDNYDTLGKFVDFLKIANDYHITFETTMIPDPQYLSFTNSSYNINNVLEKEIYPIFGTKNILYSVSPKFNMCAYRDFKNINLESIINYYKIKINPSEELLSSLNYKFVYSPDTINDLTFFVDYCIPQSFKNNVFVMPITPIPFDRNIYQQTCIEVANFCKEKGLRYSSRIHIDLWGLERGT